MVPLFQHQTILWLILLYLQTKSTNNVRRVRFDINYDDLMNFDVFHLILVNRQIYNKTRHFFYSPFNMIKRSKLFYRHNGNTSVFCFCNDCLKLQKDISENVFEESEYKLLRTIRWVLWGNFHKGCRCPDSRSINISDFNTRCPIKIAFAMLFMGGEYKYIANNSPKLFATSCVSRFWTSDGRCTGLIRNAIERHDKLNGKKIIDDVKIEEHINIFFTDEDFLFLGCSTDNLKVIKFPENDDYSSLKLSKHCLKERYSRTPKGDIMAETCVLASKIIEIFANVNFDDLLKRLATITNEKKNVK